MMFDANSSIIRTNLVTLGPVSQPVSRICIMVRSSSANFIFVVRNISKSSGSLRYGIAVSLPGLSGQAESANVRLPTIPLSLSKVYYQAYPTIGAFCEGLPVQHPMTHFQPFPMDKDEIIFHLKARNPSNTN